MKKLDSKYSKKLIDGSRYSIVAIQKSEDTQEAGVIWVPYTFTEHNEESSKEYDKFMKEYHSKHECCPKCGGKQYTTTLIGYILNRDKKDEYKDLNRCFCTACGDVHTAHDRVEIKTKI